MPQSRTGEGWGSDVRVSMPEPRQSEPLVEMDEVWCFTEYGMRHNLTEGDRHDLLHPNYVPEGWKL